MNFLNSEMTLSVLQCVEMQVTAYQKFLELFSGDKEEARAQTEIYIKALLQPQSKTRKE